MVPTRPRFSYSSICEHHCARIGSSLKTFIQRNVATISQAKLEAILRNHLAASGGDVEYGKRLVGFTQDADKVTALVELSSGATESIDCLFLVAADGAKGIDGSSTFTKFTEI